MPMNVILFILTLIVSFIVVRVGTVAFQLTGLEWSLAKFQALSCFSGTGFTTKEAELIVGHPRRRQIASVLMVVGNAGLVALIATFANSIRPRIAGASSSGWIWSGLWPVFNLVVIVAVIYATFHFFVRSKRAQKFTQYLRKKVKQSGIVEPVSFEEMMVATGGYGVVSAEVKTHSPFIGKALAQAELRAKDITVLVIRRGNDVIPNPAPDTKILEGDRLLCFGNMDGMKRQFQPEKESVS
jgi:hypothetical protein